MATAIPDQKVDGTQEFLTLGYSNWTICGLLNSFCSKVFPPSYLSCWELPFLITAERGRKEGAGAENGGKGNPPNVNETQGFLTLGHLNWTNCSLLGSLCHKNVPSLYLSWWELPFLITAERGRKEGAGAENGGKGNPPNVNETQGFLTLGHLNWTNCSLLSALHHKNVPPLYLSCWELPFLITAERGKKEGEG